MKYLLIICIIWTIGYAHSPDRLTLCFFHFQQDRRRVAFSQTVPGPAEIDSTVGHLQRGKRQHLARGHLKPGAGAVPGVTICFRVSSAVAGKIHIAAHWQEASLTHLSRHVQWRICIKQSHWLHFVLYEYKLSLQELILSSSTYTEHPEQQGVIALTHTPWQYMNISQCLRPAPTTMFLSLDVHLWTRLCFQVGTMLHTQESPFLQLSLSPAALWLSSLDVGQLDIYFLKKKKRLETLSLESTFNVKSLYLRRSDAQKFYYAFLSYPCQSESSNIQCH